MITVHFGIRGGDPACSLWASDLGDDDRLEFSSLEIMRLACDLVDADVDGRFVFAPLETPCPDCFRVAANSFVINGEGAIRAVRNRFLGDVAVDHGGLTRDKAIKLVEDPDGPVYARTSLYFNCDCSFDDIWLAVDIRCDDCGWSADECEGALVDDVIAGGYLFDISNPDDLASLDFYDGLELIEIVD